MATIFRDGLAFVGPADPTVFLAGLAFAAFVAFEEFLVDAFAALTGLVAVDFEVDFRFTPVFFTPETVLRFGVFGFDRLF